MKHMNRAVADCKTANPPVNADARASAVLCIGMWPRAGYWER